jgi:hypothetical protein
MRRLKSFRLIDRTKHAIKLFGTFLGIHRAYGSISLGCISIRLQNPELDSVDAAI